MQESLDKKLRYPCDASHEPFNQWGEALCLQTAMEGRAHQKAWKCLRISLGHRTDTNATSLSEAHLAFSVLARMLLCKGRAAARRKRLPARPPAKSQDLPARGLIRLICHMPPSYGNKNKLAQVSLNTPTMSCQRTINDKLCWLCCRTITSDCDGSTYSLDFPMRPISTLTLRKTSQAVARFDANTSAILRVGPLRVQVRSSAGPPERSRDILTNVASVRTFRTTPCEVTCTTKAENHTAAINRQICAGMSVRRFASRNLS